MDAHSPASPGPVLLQDYQVLEKLASLNRERLPERVVHAKGAVTEGHFVVRPMQGRPFCYNSVFSP